MLVTFDPVLLCAPPYPTFINSFLVNVYGSKHKQKILEKATGNHSSTLPKKTTMAATNREWENEAPRLDDSKLATGEGRSTVTSTCIQNGAGGLKPQGDSPADVDAEERTAENRRSLREMMRIGTWNERTMNQGKLDIMKRDMERTGVDLVGITEMRWTGMGHFMSDEYEVFYCGQDTLRRNGVAFICTDEIRRCFMGFNPVSNRIVTIRLQCKPVNMTVLQVCAPTSTAEEEEKEDFYEKVQHVVDDISR